MKDLDNTLFTIGDSLKFDIQFLTEGLGKGVESFRKKFNQRNAPEETLKSLNWEIVEFYSLLGQATDFMTAIRSSTDILAAGEHHQRSVKQARESWVKQCGNHLAYLRNLFKKKRQCATHILVFMLSDEKWDKKPYATPVQYIPYHSLQDQELRDLVKKIKVELNNANIKAVGRQDVLYMYFNPFIVVVSF